MADLAIENMGAVTSFESELPQGPGLVEILGPNGAGKSTIIRCVDAMAGGSPSEKLSVRVGATTGSVELFGVRATFRQRLGKPSGELELARLEGTELGDLIDPGIEKPESANKARLKAIARLANAAIDLHSFVHLVDGGMDALLDICGANIEHGRDAVELQEAVKAALEKRALSHERAANGIAQRAAAKRDAAKGLIDGREIASVPPLDVARERQSSAQRELYTAEGQQRATEALIASGERARAALDAMGARGTLVHTTELVEDYQAKVAALELEIKESEQEEQRLSAANESARTYVERLERELAVAKEQHIGASRALAQHRDGPRRALGSKLYETRQAWDAAVRRADEDAKQRDQLIHAVSEASSATPITESDLDTLRKAVEAAQAESELARLVDESLHLQNEARQIQQQADVESTLGAKLRSAAKETELVLMAAVEAVCTDGLSLSGGWLMVEHPTLGVIQFGKLSPGERARVACRVVARAARLRSGGRLPIVVIGQHYYEDMQPAARRELAAICREENVLAFGELPDDGPLRLRLVS